PSLVIVGEPKDFSMTTLRPFGPRVTFTAFARVLTPLSIRSRARESKTISFAIVVQPRIVRTEWSVGSDGMRSVLDHAEDVVLAEDQELLTLHLDLRSGVLGEQDPVTLLHVQGTDGAVLEDPAVANGDHLALERLLLGGLGDDDATLGLLLLLDPLHDDAVLEWPDLHVFLLKFHSGGWLAGLEIGTPAVRVPTAREI